MKKTQMMQLTIQVNTCLLPQLPYQQYSLTALLGIKLDKNLSASTSFKDQKDGIVDFATKLYLKVEKNIFQESQNCSILVFGLSSKGIKTQLAKGIAFPLAEGPQNIKMEIAQKQDAFLEVSIQFWANICENRNKDSKLRNYKSKMQEISAASEKGQGTINNCCEPIERKQNIAQNCNTNPQFPIEAQKGKKTAELQMTSDSKVIRTIKSEENIQKKRIKSPLNLNVQPKLIPQIPKDKKVNRCRRAQCSSNKLQVSSPCKRLMKSYQKAQMLQKQKQSKKSITNKKPNIPKIPKNIKSARSIEPPKSPKLKSPRQKAEKAFKNSNNIGNDSSSSLGSMTMELDILRQPKCHLPINSRVRQIDNNTPSHQFQ